MKNTTHEKILVFKLKLQPAKNFKCGSENFWLPVKWKRAREIGLNRWKKVEKVQKGDYTSTKKKLGQIIGENSEKISVLSGKLR